MTLENQNEAGAVEDRGAGRRLRRTDLCLDCIKAIGERSLLQRAVRMFGQFGEWHFRGSLAEALGRLTVSGFQCRLPSRRGGASLSYQAHEDAPGMEAGAAAEGLSQCSDDAPKMDFIITLGDQVPEGFATWQASTRYALAHHRTDRRGHTCASEE